MDLRKLVLLISVIFFASAQANSTTNATIQVSNQTAPASQPPANAFIDTGAPNEC